jgi:hypothetical protein
LVSPHVGQVFILIVTIIFVFICTPFYSMALQIFGEDANPYRTGRQY